MSVTKKLKEVDKKYPLKRVNKLIDNLIMIVGITCMFLGTYCLLDNYNVYNQVTRTQKLGFRSEVSENSITFSDVPLAKAWLTIPDTQVNYPIMQGKDNLEYINKDCFGKYSLSGSIFADFQNKSDFTDKYNLLYGHHMDNGGMYGDVMEYINKDYFDKHLTGNLFMPDGRARKMEVFACIECDAYDRMIYQVEGKKGHIMELVEYLKKHSTNFRDIGLKESDQIMSLSTCVSLETNGRVVLFARVNP